MIDRYSLGSVARLYFSVVSSGAGVAGLVPTTAIQRIADGSWFQLSDGMWVPTIVANPMIELDVANCPGLYAFDFDQTLDLLKGSSRYLVKHIDTATPETVYREVVFGPMANAIAPELCSVQGTIFNGRGEPQPNALVRAVLEPVFKDSLARTFADRTVATYSDDLGGFDLPLVRDATYRLEIDAVGFDRKVLIPNQASVLFTDI